CRALADIGIQRYRIAGTPVNLRTVTQQQIEKVGNPHSLITDAAFTDSACPSLPVRPFGQFLSECRLKHGFWLAGWRSGRLRGRTLSVRRPDSMRNRRTTGIRMVTITC